MILYRLSFLIFHAVLILQLMACSPWRSHHAQAQWTQLERQVPKDALSYGLRAKYNAEQQGYVPHQSFMGLVDLSLPSNQKRFWILNTDYPEIILKTWVAHGKRSGGLQAYHFSNRINSYASSLGLYQTGVPYIGKFGWAIPLHGLDMGWNHKAYERRVVIHASPKDHFWYVYQHKQLWSSLGCPSLKASDMPMVLRYLKPHTLVLIYYPSMSWLMDSVFMQEKYIYPPKMNFHFLNTNF